jgi:hypothetical protein
MHYTKPHELFATGFESLKLLEIQFELTSPLASEVGPRLTQFVSIATAAEETNGQGLKVFRDQDEPMSEYILDYAQRTKVRAAVIEHCILAMAEGYIGGINKSRLRGPGDVEAAMGFLKQMESLFNTGSYSFLHNNIVGSADTIKDVGAMVQSPPLFASACGVAHLSLIGLANSIARIEETGIRAFVLLRRKLENSGLPHPPIIITSRVIESVVRSGRQSFEPMPDDETVVWRYFSFPKFIALLQSKSLYFPSALVLEQKADPAEGEYTLADRDLMSSTFEGYPELRAAMLDAASLIKGVTYINSWHIRADESAEMWKAYAPTGGVAIKSSVKRIRESFSTPDVKVCATRVRYVDEQKDVTEQQGIHSPFVIKRRLFEFEAELRLMFVDAISDSPGQNVPVEITTLIYEVVLGPDAEPWIQGLVQSLLTEKGVSCAVRVSSLQ